MRVLAVSDIVVDRIYNPQIRLLYSDIDLVIGCGDLPQYYLEFIVSTLDIPVFYVHGNHSLVAEHDNDKPSFRSLGSFDLHGKVVRFNGLTFAGVEGSIRYKEGAFQYSQFEMWLNVIKIIPGFLLNRIRYGRFLNVFVSHASPWGIHDQPDYTHQGIKAFRWLIRIFLPDYHFHGHIHVYRPDTIRQTLFGRTHVINVYGYQVIELSPC